MMKKTTMWAICLLSVMFIQAQGIRFEENVSWKEIQAKAKTENKYIFMDAYATWCQPCKAMAAETFQEASVGGVINANFIPVKVQMDKTKEDDEVIKSWYADAKAIAKQSNLTAYPTLLFFSPEGKLVHKTIGYKDAEALIAEAKNALNPATQFFVLLDQYKRGKMDTTQIKALAAQAKQIGDNATANMVAQGYIKNISKKDLYKKGNIVFIAQFLNGSKDPNFNMFLKNGKKVNEVMGKNFAENKVMSVVSEEEVEPYDKQKNPDWDAIEKRAEAKYGALGQERVWGHMTVYYSSIEAWDNFGKYYKKYFDVAVPNDRSFLNINNLSWPVFENVTDESILATAVKTMKYDIEKFDGNDAPAIDTYANLLYKTGKKEEAIRWEEKAVKLSNNEKSMVETLQKMKKDEPTWK